MIEEINFKNRETGCIETEKVYGGNWLSFIYGTPLGKLSLWAAIQRSWFSKWYGRKMDSIKSKEKILPFISEFNLDENEFLKKSSEFESFNDFFSRELKENARPIIPF